MSARYFLTLAALIIAACASSTSAPRTAAPRLADSCALVRPDFGVATAADRKLFAYNVAAPLNLQKAVEGTKDGVEVSAISFDSPGGGRATGLSFDPVTRSDPRPGIVLMHGFGGNARNMAGIAQMLASRGAVVLAIDAPYVRRTGDPVRGTVEDRAEQIQLIKDLQRAVDVLRARSNVDSKRIAYVGFSYGGSMGVLFVGIERRIKAAVLAVADGGLVSHDSFLDDANGLLASMPCGARVAWLRAMTPIEPIRFIGQASPTALLLQNGRLDKAVTVANAEAVHAAAPQPKTIRWYDAGHLLNPQAAADMVDWLHEQISLDPRK